MLTRLAPTLVAVTALATDASSIVGGAVVDDRLIGIGALLRRAARDKVCCLGCATVVVCI
jgi:hypothetical protein